MGKANWKVLHLAQNIKSGVLMNQRIKQTLFQMLILAPRASWGPENEDQEAAGDTGLEVLDLGLPIISDFLQRF